MLFRSDAAYQSMFLDGAQGVNLDRLIELLGLTRNLATPTVVYSASLHNSDLAIAYTVPQGAIVQHQATGELFATETAVTIAALAEFASRRLASERRVQLVVRPP